jgi:ferredoxin-NADP reductase
VVLYFGARRHQDLYDLAELQEMEVAYPWLQVIPAVSDEPARDSVMYGTVPELAAKATWTDRDIYVSGPDAMIVKTVQVLKARGAPGHLIRYDRGGQAELAARRRAGPRALASQARSDLAPAGGPGAVGHGVIPEQGGRFVAHDLADLAEH